MPKGQVFPAWARQELAHSSHLRFPRLPTSPHAPTQLCSRVLSFLTLSFRVRRTLSTSAMYSVTSSPFVSSLASPDPPPFSSVPSLLTLCNFICPWRGPRGRTVREPWCYPQHCRNPSGHKHPADVHIWALPLTCGVTFDKCLPSRCLRSLVFKIKLGQRK